MGPPGIPHCPTPAALLGGAGGGHGQKHRQELGGLGLDLPLITGHLGPHLMGGITPSPKETSWASRDCTHDTHLGGTSTDTRSRMFIAPRSPELKGGNKPNARQNTSGKGER